MRFRLYVTGDKSARKALRELAPAVNKAVRKRFRAIAAEAADEARSRAGWSVKIPPGITSGTTLRGPYIRYRGAAPEIGRLNELRDRWRHPLYGNRLHWYTQYGRKFLQPAAEAKWDKVMREAGAAVNEAIEETGL